MNTNDKWRFTIPLNELTINGIEVKVNYWQTILNFPKIEDLSIIAKTDLEIKDVDLDEIHKHMIFHDWIERHFPLMHELEYELSIWHHTNDIVDFFDGNEFKIATRWDGLAMIICKYKNIEGYFAITGKQKPDVANILKYVDREVTKATA
ncbi:MAG: hypothetical protein A4E23_01258 [Methanomethylovorans sp. PtaU1.Bin073]|jgi:hypothetical protein|nr:MAG: hypothetical protein A4E23_01258 [Methanomethylovorans sp. PtaU1.Bin073]